MKKFINVKPTCKTCDGELIITNFQVDLINCNYVIFAECIICGEEHMYVLALEDFIELGNMEKSGG